MLNVIKDTLKNQNRSTVKRNCVLFTIVCILISSTLYGQRKRVQFGANAYTIEDTLDLAGSPLTYSNNNTYILCGNAVIVNSGAACNAIGITADSVYIVGNLIINSSNINIGIYLNGADNCMIDGVKIKGINQQAVYLTRFPYTLAISDTSVVVGETLTLDLDNYLAGSDTFGISYEYTSKKLSRTSVVMRDG